MGSKTDAIYPDVKLGDFELAMETSATDPFNPTTLRGNAFPVGWAPPEIRTVDSRLMCVQVGGRDPGDLTNEQILAPANVRSTTYTQYGMKLIWHLPRFGVLD